MRCPNCNMKLINADKLKINLDKRFSFGLENKFMLFDEIDNADVFDLEAHDNEIRADFADKIKDHLSDIESNIVEQRNKPQSAADLKMLVGMQVCIEDFLSWLNDNAVKEK